MDENDLAAMPAIRASFKSGVHDAALMLDRVQPGWAARIDTNLLDMDSLDHCILGQLYRPSSTSWLMRLMHDPTTRCGYSIGRRALQDEPEYASGLFAGRAFTQDAWIAEIAARLHPVTEEPAEQTQQTLDLVEV